MGASLLPSIAYRVNEQWSIGASINAMYGYFKSVTAINNVLDAGTDGKLQMRDTTWGWGGNVGILYEPTKTTRFGLTYSSQVKLDFTSPAQFSGTGPILTTGTSQPRDTQRPDQYEYHGAAAADGKFLPHAERPVDDHGQRRLAAMVEVRRS